MPKVEFHFEPSVPRYEANGSNPRPLGSFGCGDSVAVVRIIAVPRAVRIITPVSAVKPVAEPMVKTAAKATVKNTAFKTAAGESAAMEATTGESAAMEATTVKAAAMEAAAMEAAAMEAATMKTAATVETAATTMKTAAAVAPATAAVAPAAAMGCFGR